MTPNVDSEHGTSTSTSTEIPTSSSSNLEFAYVHSAVRTPPPPGFSVDDKKDLSFYGFNRAGAGSAPPRSLISDGLDGLDGLGGLSSVSLGNGHGFTSTSSRGGSGGGMGIGIDDLNLNSTSISTHDNFQNLRMMLRPSPTKDDNGSGGSGGGSRNGTRGGGGENGGRSSSFANLAEALGDSLAESMGNSLVESLRNETMPRLPEEPDHNMKPKDGTNQGGICRNNNNNSTTTKNGSSGVDMGIDNFARQSRHTLSRLVGSSAGLAGVGVDPRDLMHQMAHHRTNMNGANGNGARNNSRSNHNNSNSLDHHHHSSLYSSSTQSHNSNGHHSHSSGLRSIKVDGNIVTVVEPSTPSPAPHQIRMHFGQKESGHHPNDIDMNINMNPGFSSHFGRSSAPPQVFDGNDSVAAHLFTSNSTALRQHTASSLQRRAAELRDLQIQKKVVVERGGAVVAASPAQTPVPSFSNAPSYSVHSHNYHHRPPSASPHPQEHETETEHELRLFIWSANANNNRSSSHGHSNFSTSNNSNSPSRALAIFGASQLPISEVRSTCEAFGSLLYFRSEFCSTKNVIFVAYHDLRSACHASKELKTYLQRIASSNSNLNEIESITCRDALKVLYSVSLTASSEYHDSALIFFNVPYGIDKEQFTQMMTSFGAVQSVDRQNLTNEDASGSICFGVCFYDVQDASHCILEMKSTMPWGSRVSIKSQTRAENERKRGQDFLSLISSWRRGSGTTPVSSMQNNIPQNIATERLSSTSSPSTSSLSPKIQSEENLRQINNPSTASTAESTTPPITFNPQAPQLVVGPDGQYSYVMIQPHVYQASSSQYAQPSAAVLPSPISPPHQAHPIPAPHYVFDGQNYWLQPPAREQHQHQHPIPNSHAHAHVPTYHQVSNPPGVAAYPVMPIYPMTANPSGQGAIPTDSSLSSGGSQNHPTHQHQHQNHSYVAAKVPLAEARKETNDKADNNNQRNYLDLEAVEKGWDIRTSLMIRNIPNKYTRSMLLSEFKECGHGPGKIDFFYLPIDFRNKCNRGYAFVNFVDYRDIISFHHVYNGKGWKTFKSDKICEISYARIQGKSSMLKRFQNSALMDKDPEYRPVVFNNNGEICSPEDENIS